MKELFKYMHKPQPYAPSTGAFWDDEHISKGMLKAHLDPAGDGATRNLAFVEQSAQWLIDTFPAETYPFLLDLGCGPGIYGELFARAGFCVTGVDFSRRSIDYATESAQKAKLDITYRYMDYLTLDYCEQFDIITLIWCDFGVLSPADRKTLLQKMHTALKPGGILVLDVFSEQKFLEKKESKTYEYFPQGGFWQAGEHACLSSLYKYADRVVAEQAIILREGKIDCFNIWEHYFSRQELEEELAMHGFSQLRVFSDIAGKEYSPDSLTICFAARKAGELCK